MCQRILNHPQCHDCNTLSYTAKCIDHYTQQRVKIYENIHSTDGKDIVIDPKLEAVVNRMFRRCFDDGKYKQVKSKSLHVVIGIGIYHGHQTFNVI